ncbi:MAG: PIN domain-containing protein [Chloroflexota bacterium]|nr:PIN domain-containing protein [Chloroflexota bacterium]
MSDPIFVDSAAWLALTDSTDSYHAAARATYAQLEQQGSLWITTNLVLAESHILILRRGDYAVAMSFLDFLRNSGNVQLIYSSLERELQAEIMLRKYKDQPFSYVDAVSFAVMQQRGIHTAFSFDNHFRVARFQLAPGPSR